MGLGIPAGSIVVAAGKTTQALSSTAGQVVAFSATGGSVGQGQVAGAGIGNDYGVIPDPTNNRMLVVQTGVYEIYAQVMGPVTSSADLFLQVYKNGVAQPDLYAETFAGLVPYTLSATLSPAVVSGWNISEQSFTGFAVNSGDIPLGNAQKPTSQSGLFVGNTRISGTTVFIEFGNVSSGGSALPPAGEVYTLTVLRQGRGSIIVKGLLNVTPADNPKTIANMPAASTTGFGGASGAPDVMVPVTLFMGTLSGTPTITVEYATFQIWKIY